MRLFLWLLAVLPAFAAEHPNIVVILADDLGIGDVRAHNAASKIETPHLDRLAREGMRFTDAHTPSSVCTPTRYGLLTGRYNWRSKLQSGVLGGLSPRLIEPGRVTVAQLLKDQGYATACIGKWHLGLDWAKKAGRDVEELEIEKAGQTDAVDFSKPFANGPLTLGFDDFFGIAASLDMVPYTYLRGDRVVSHPDYAGAFPMMGDRPSGAQTRKGPRAADFEAIDVLPRLTTEAVRWIARRAQEKPPFFLYLPLPAPHTPTLPTADWAGRSQLNAYADFVMQVDASVGAVLKAIDNSGIKDRTLVIFTSDNGCSPQARIVELRGKGHDPCAGFRGTKADIWEGGHRVPFLARWPGTIDAGTSSNALICLTDLFATCAELTDTEIPDTAGEDSISILPALRGGKGNRLSLVSHSISGHFAIRKGSMKLCLTPGSGGWSAPKPGSDAEKDLPADQLFDLQADSGETKNLAAEKPEVVRELTTLLEEQVRNGRSAPGAPQNNAVEVKIRKRAK